MRALLSPIIRLADSITGRTFLILSVGVTTAAVLSLGLVVHTRALEFEAMRQSEVVARAQQLQTRWEAVSRGEQPRASLDTIMGIRILDRSPAYEPDPETERHLNTVLGSASAPRAGKVPVEACLPEIAAKQLDTEPNRSFATRVECWLISFVATDGQRVNAAMFAPPFVSPVGPAVSPLYLLALLLASALMSLLVARLVTRPLRRLSDAAAAFSVSLDAPDTAIRGPSEVRTALATFNIMQSRVREGLLSRTQLLASVSHDLQTPLTRMRLRIEQVRDREVREKLVADIQVMQRLVREGLELARSHETQEPWSLVDIDSLIGSLAEDAVEVGAQVSVVSTCGANIEVRPNALGRALINLIDNAVKYGGSAEITCRPENGSVRIEIRDRGPGLPDPEDPRLFEPFYRVEGKDAAKGHGVGLTIARAQAELSGASVRLWNHPEGGLVAEVFIAR